MSGPLSYLCDHALQSMEGYAGRLVSAQCFFSVSALSSPLAQACVTASTDLEGRAESPKSSAYCSVTPVGAQDPEMDGELSRHTKCSKVLERRKTVPQAQGGLGLYSLMAASTVLQDAPGYSCLTIGSLI